MWTHCCAVLRMLCMHPAQATSSWHACLELLPLRIWISCICCLLSSAPSKSQKRPRAHVIWNWFRSSQESMGCYFHVLCFNCWVILSWEQTIDDTVPAACSKFQKLVFFFCAFTFTQNISGPIFVSNKRMRLIRNSVWPSERNIYNFTLLPAPQNFFTCVNSSQ